MDLQYKNKYKKYKQKYFLLKNKEDFQITSPLTEFISELDKRSKIIFGENNAAEYNLKGIADPRVAFFFKAVRNLSEQQIEEFIENIIDLYETMGKKDENILQDLFLIMFQTMDIRGGKREKKIFYLILLHLFKYFPKTIINLLALIPFYGYFKDYFLLMELINENLEDNQNLINKIFDLVINQLKKDANEYTEKIKTDKKPKISLLAKYIPKENEHFDRKLNFVTQIVKKMFFQNQNKITEKELNDAKKIYRQLVSSLNIYLDIPEIKMSANKYSEIDFTKISSKCTFKYRKSFLNQNIKTTKLKSNDKKDREICKKHFLKSIEEKNIKGKQLEIYELVKFVFNNKNLTNDEIKLFQLLWDNVKKSLVESINISNNDTDLKFGSMIPVVDVSGSMIGIPLYVAVSMGILLSEINLEPLKNKIITFSEKPTWIDLSNRKNIIDKIIELLKSNSGLNTDFEAIYDLLLDITEINNLKKEQIPDIIVFSDMQFDKARKSDKVWETHYNILKKKFNQIGVKISGQPYQPPKIIFWNLRSETLGFPVQANTPNVQMISGFCPNLFKHVLSNKKLSEFDIPNPYTILRNILDDDKYDIIREIVYLTNEIKIKKRF
ncbi:Domain of unknown function (DUF2828)-containing protein [uncultured virus]|nr:Domain of unknown function (DUF2828)-containing protein [uncultured virus]